MQIDTDMIAQAILSAPGWARVGITAPDEHLRHNAARELACAILGTDPKPRWLDEQLKLSL